jgi:mono/diheme cytochrome c family protein
MSLLYVKSVVSIFFMIAGLIALLCMFGLMGRSERKVSPQALRITHRIAGVIFAVLLGVLTYMCIEYIEIVGDQMSVRAVFHSILALGLIVVFIIKIAIVQYYREFMRLVPTLGIIVFILAFVVFFSSAGFFFLMSGRPGGAAEAVGAGETVVDVAGEPGPGQMTAAQVAGGNAERGRGLYDARCGSCHHADSEDAMFGPGFKGLLKKETLPSSGRPATAANIIKQLKTPVGVMPPFTRLSDNEVADLVAYLETL